MARRKLGVCTWTFGPLPLAEIAARLGRLGFDGVELHGDLETFKPPEVLGVLGGQGLEVFSLTPASVDLAHPHAGVRARALDYYRRLVDFAAALGGPLVSCHGDVGRVAPLSSQAQEWDWLAEGVTQVCDHARSAGVSVVFEVLNRYETHLVNTGEEALRLQKAVGADNLKVLLDAYHMNLEESDLPQAIRRVGAELGLFHVADSNRGGIGQGHTDFVALWAALKDVGYAGPVIVEATAPGPNPFTPVKSGDYLGQLEQYLSDSLCWLRAA